MPADAPPASVVFPRLARREDICDGPPVHLPRRKDGGPPTRDDWIRFFPLIEEGPDIVYEAYVVAHAGTPSERHVRVYRGPCGMFVELLIDEAIAEGFGTFGYITKNGARVEYHRGRSSLKSVG